MPAATAHETPRQQGRSLTHNTAGLGGVGGELVQIPFVLRPADVGRQAVLEQHLPVFGSGNRASGCRSPGLAAAWIGGTTTVGVGAGIDRVAQQVAERGAVRAAPVELAGARTAADAVGQLQLTVDQVAQHPIDRPATLELGKHRLDHAARLLIGVFDDVAGGCAQIASWQQQVQLAAACLGPFALEQALFEDMQLGFRHRPLEPQQQPIVVRLRIIDPVGIPDQGAEQAADLQQLIPVP